VSLCIKAGHAHEKTSCGHQSLHLLKPADSLVCVCLPSVHAKLFLQMKIWRLPGFVGAITNWKRRARGGAHEALTLVSTDAVNTRGSTVHDPEPLHARSCEGQPIRPAKQAPIPHQHLHQHLGGYRRLQYLLQRRLRQPPPCHPPRRPRSPSPPRYSCALTCAGAVS